MRPPRQPSSRLIIVTGVLILLVAVTAWAFYAFNKTNSAEKTTQPTQNATILSVNTSLQQNGATQICSAGNAGPGNLTASSTDVVYEISKNHTDTVTIIQKVATDGGYGNLTHTTNGSADFYEGKSKDASTTIDFVVYSDRKYTSCQPTPSTDPNQTAFMLSMMSGH